MTATFAQRQQVIEWSVASRPLPGEAVSGDLHVVVTWDGGALVGVVDGLGHGAEATQAARLATQQLEGHAREALIPLVQRCHAALRATRGVVMTLLAFDAGTATVTAVGIGNVETLVLHANRGRAARRHSVLLRGGVVGYQLPALQTEEFAVEAGDVAVFATDGVREDFGDVVDAAAPLPQLVERVLAQKFRGTDDGLVLACRYRGNA